MNERSTSKIESADKRMALKLRMMAAGDQIPILSRIGSGDPMLEQRKAENIRAEFVEEYVNDTLKEFNQRLFSSLMPYGLFEGIEIPSLQDLQAAIGQKFLGVYEFEILDHIKHLLKNYSYDFIIDIGAAEGLYAVAFSKHVAAKGDETRIFAFEQSYFTRERLRQTVKRNKATNVHILDEFNQHSIKDIDPEKKGLILSDCEGYEDRIFSKANASRFKNCNLVIETHDNVVPGVTERLLELLSDTHSVQRVEQQPVVNSIALITNEWFRLLDEKQQLDILECDRHPETRWVVAEANRLNEQPA